MLRQAIWKTSANILEICITGPLSYSVVTDQEMMFEKISVLDMLNLDTAC